VSGSGRVCGALTVNEPQVMNLK